jgi:hypothetical protein
MRTHKLDDRQKAIASVPEVAIALHLPVNSTLAQSLPTTITVRLVEEYKEVSLSNAPSTTDPFASSSTGVYYDNVELKKSMHPHQSHVNKDLIKRSIAPSAGKPLPRPPQLLKLPQIPAGLVSSSASVTSIASSKRSLSPPLTTIGEYLQSQPGVHLSLSANERIFVEAAAKLATSVTPPPTKQQKITGIGQPPFCLSLI